MGAFEKKVVVITGAGGGLGRAHALSFAKEGARVVVNDLGGKRDGEGQSQNMADAVVMEIEKLGGQAVPSYDNVATANGAQAIVGKALSTWGRIDVLVNNAGILRDKTLLKMDPEAFDQVIAVHLRGTTLCTQAAARAMVEQGEGGRIINTTSLAGLQGNFGQTNYAAAKAGIYGVTRVASMELAKHGITVNAVAPVAKTRMTEELVAVPDELKPEHISPMVVYLASKQAAEVNGRVFGVHGLHIFEYAMKVSDGVRAQGEWRWQQIGERLNEIAAFDAPIPKANAEETAIGNSQKETPEARIRAVFERMPAGFLPEKAAGWKAVIHFQIKGGGDHTLTISGTQATYVPGLEGESTCLVKTDADTYLGMIEGRVDGQQAFMQGKFSANNIADVMKLRTCFSKEKAAASAPTPAENPSASSTKSAGPKARITEVMEQMPAAFLPEKAGTWAAVIHFQIQGGGEHTLKIGECRASYVPGLEGEGTCLVKTDADTYLGMIEGRVDGQQAFMQGKISATNLSDMMKLRTCFSKEKAASARPTVPVASGTPKSSGGSKPPVLSASEKAQWMFKLAGRLFESGDLQEASGTLGLDFIDGERFVLVAADGGVAAERWVEGGTHQPKARIRTDQKTFFDFVDEKLDGARATSELDLLATPMSALLAVARRLRKVDYTKHIAEAKAHRPVRVGRGYEEKSFHAPPQIVEKEHIAQFAAATNDPNPAYEAEGDGLAPPMLAVRYFHPLAGLALTDGDIEVDLLRLVHGEQRLTFARPLRVGMVLCPKSRLESVEEKESGTLLTFKNRLLCEGEVVAEGTSGYFVRTKNTGRKKGPALDASYEAAGPGDEAIQIPVDADQSLRYARASLDDNPIHIDDAIARAAGFPGVILHGLCTLALSSKTLINTQAAGDPLRLKGIAARFEKPVLPGTALSLRIHGADSPNPTRLAFSVTDPEGRQVLGRGEAQFDRSSK
jgi:NAD(P)-dependent dehydrogenase (short-subunit alcohol dehydrogenase family)/acyl dehydratase/putative sterol carrier protein